MGFDLSSLQWYPLSLPSTTSLTSIAATGRSGAETTLSSASQAIQTASSTVIIQSLGKRIRGAQATLTVILAENAMATATDNTYKSRMDELLLNTTLNLESLAKDNLYGEAKLNIPANAIYTAVFGILLVYFTAMMWKSRYHWFNVSFFCGYGLEFGGFVARLCSESNMFAMEPYICQLVVLTIAPVFIMAAIYFLLAQCITIYGPQYSLLKPMWYSYIFIACDITSIVIQALGGGLASSASNRGKDTHPGTSVMVAGLAFQVFTMSCFLICLLAFLLRIYFLPSKNLRNLMNTEEEDYEDIRKFLRITLSNFLKLFFNTRSVFNYKTNYLEKHYPEEYKDKRARNLFPFFPFALFAGTAFVYVRCIYRVVELAQGFSGYLITHEVFLMVLDALFIALCGFVFVPFHPYFALGPKSISIKEVKGATKMEESSEKEAKSINLFEVDSIEQVRQQAKLNIMKEQKSLDN